MPQTLSSLRDNPQHLASRAHANILISRRELAFIAYTDMIPAKIQDTLGRNASLGAIGHAAVSALAAYEEHIPYATTGGNQLTGWLERNLLAPTAILRLEIQGMLMRVTIVPRQKIGGEPYHSFVFPDPDAAGAGLYPILKLAMHLAEIEFNHLRIQQEAQQELTTERAHRASLSEKLTILDRSHAKLSEKLCDTLGYSVLQTDEIDQLVRSVAKKERQIDAQRIALENAESRIRESDEKIETIYRNFKTAPKYIGERPQPSRALTRPGIER